MSFLIEYFRVSIAKRELDIAANEILVDGMLYSGSSKKDELEVTIGEGMEFTIHGRELLT